ncbi:response regulator [Pseudoroseomonas ludipueritiae]|uniref:response regulator n=1 Tax=Pseudoroseomonas ludipueritiae TaxID=198093 RepID=UPI0023B02F63|nr:response regulator [Pseudoroseomonas ludipueritiae]
MVDDKNLVHHTTATRIRAHGYRVVEARKGRAAMRPLDEVRPDLLVTHVGLPGGMNGRQVAEAVRGPYSPAAAGAGPA